jgi:hypothetical protein
MSINQINKTLVNKRIKDKITLIETLKQKISNTNYNSSYQEQLDKGELELLYEELKSLRTHFLTSLV